MRWVCATLRFASSRRASQDWRVGERWRDGAGAVQGVVGEGERDRERSSSGGEGEREGRERVQRVNRLRLRSMVSIDGWGWGWVLSGCGQGERQQRADCRHQEFGREYRVWDIERERAER